MQKSNLKPLEQLPENSVDSVKNRLLPFSKEILENVAEKFGTPAWVTVLAVQSVVLLLPHSSLLKFVLLKR